MKRFSIFFFISSIVFYASVSFAAEKNKALAEPLIYISTGDYPPYVSRAETGGGVTTQLVRRLCRIAKLRCIIRHKSWQSALDLLKRGQYQASFPWIETPARKQQFLYAKAPLYSSPVAVFYRASTGHDFADIQDYAALKGFQVAGVLHYWYESLLRQNHVPTRWVGESERAWQLLAKGRVQLIIDDVYAGKHQLATHPHMHKIKHAYHVLQQVKPLQAYIIFDRHEPQSRRLKTLMDEAYRKLQLADGLEAFKPIHSTKS